MNTAFQLLKSAYTHGWIVYVREYDLSACDEQEVAIRVRLENLGAKEGDGMLLDNFEVLGEIP